MKNDFIKKENKDNPAFLPYKAPQSEDDQIPLDKMPPISNYLVWAILSTFSCFPPLGMVAIIFAIRSQLRIKRGDFNGARYDAEYAKKWGIISAVLLPIAIFLFLCLMLFINIFEITA